MHGDGGLLEEDGLVHEGLLGFQLGDLLPENLLLELEAVQLVHDPLLDLHAERQLLVEQYRCLSQMRGNGR